MQEIFISILTALFGISGIVAFIGYLPTIMELWRGKASATTFSYLIWALCFLIMSLYGFFVLHDILFDVVINLQLFACIIILILRLRLPK